MGEQWVIFQYPQRQHSAGVLGTEKNPNWFGRLVNDQWLNGALQPSPKRDQEHPWKRRLQLWMSKYLSHVLLREKRPKAKPEGVKEKDDPVLFRRNWYFPRGSDVRQALTHWCSMFSLCVEFSAAGSSEVSLFGSIATKLSPVSSWRLKPT